MTLIQLSVLFPIQINKPHETYYYEEKAKPTSY
jgi:hypothetical protein